MRTFRSPALLRLATALAVVGVASTLAPSAVARDARAVSLRVLLDDAEAFAVALDAARAASGEEDPVRVFAEAYAEAVGQGLTADTVYDLLDGEALGLTAPAAPDEASVSVPPILAGPGSVYGVLPASRAAAGLPATSAAAAEAALLTSRPEAVFHRPRAP